MPQCQFPDDFDWGVATASYQIEGAWNEDGKGEGIWDRFTHNPGNIQDNSTGDEACDFFHRYEEDIRIAKSLGIKVYRFSVSWPRVIPLGTGAVNEKGIQFYRNVLQCLRDNGIKSALTMYHWDLPQKLQDRGGWANRQIVDWFTGYVKILYERLGDLVDMWITLNEPVCTSMAGYWHGEHAPGYHDYSMALAASHHLLLCHGAAVKEYRKTGLKADIGITLNMNMSYPFDPSAAADIEGAKRNQLHGNNMFGDPVFLGTYPEELFEFLKKKGVVLPEIKSGDMELIHQKLDFFGLNTYSVSYIKADSSSWPLEAKAVKSGKPVTDAGWEVAPEGMYELLKWINGRYKPQKLIITENGAACNDWVNAGGEVVDPNRIDYLKRYLSEVHRAMGEGVPVKGYYVWCFCDNFEWAWGLSRRFGIVYVDYATQKRTPKESAYWYSDLIKLNGFEY
jgi:beta-glucosidase